VLAAGEPAVVLDSGQPAELVLGDGVTAMTDLRRAVWGDDARLAAAATATQPGDLGTAAAANVADLGTAAQGAKADTAVQPADLSFVSTPAPGRRGGKVILVGDSHVQGSPSNGTGSDWLAAKNYPTGGGQLAWALWLSQSRLTFWGNYGIGGERTDQVYARRAAYLNTGADLAIVQMGTNDSRQGYTLAHTQQYYAATVEALLDAGMDVILVGVPPCVDGQDGQDQRNAWIASYASRMRLPFVDSFSPVVDTATRAIATAYNGDGVHLNGLGAKVTGQKVADAIGRLYAPVEGLVAASNADATNILSNALGLTDATADGIPDGWSTLGAPTGGTATHTLETVTGWTGEAFAVEMVTNTNPRQLYFSSPLASGKWAPGDRMRAAVRVKTTGSLSEVQARVEFPSATGGRTLARFLQCKGTNIDDGLASVEFVVPPSTSPLAFYLYVGTGTGKAWFGQPTLTNLTALGITDGPEG